MNIAHVASYFLARAIPGVISFAAIAVYSRLLEPAAYGEYAIALVWASVVGTCMFQWLRSSLVRYYAEHSANEGDLYSAVSSAYVLLAVALSSLGVIYLLAFRGSDESQLVLLVLMVVLVQGLFDLSLELKNAKQQPLGFGALASTKALVGLLFGSILIGLLGFRAAGPLLGIALGAVVAVLLFGRALWAHVWPPRSVGRLLPSMLRYGLPLSFATLLNVAVHGGDRILIAHFMGPAEVGIYAAGFDLAQQSLGVLMTVLSLAFVPGVFRTYETQGSEAARESVSRYGLVFIAFLLPATIGIALLGQNIASVVLGNQFANDAALIIPVVAVAILLSGTKAFYFDVAFQLAKRTGPQVYIAALMAVLNIVLNVVLIPANGVIGAGYACAVSYGTGLVFSVLWGSRIFHMPRWHAELTKVVLAALVLVVCLLTVEHLRGVLALAFQVSLGCLAYAVTMALLRFRGFGPAL